MTPSPARDPKQRSVELIEEYKALRSEILLRIQLRNQMLGLAITMFAAIAALTFRETFPKEVLLVYPLLALFIAFEWANHDQRIFSLSYFIKTKIEPHSEGLRWQHHLDEDRKTRRLRFSSFAAGGIFVVASAVNLLVVIGEVLGGRLLREYGPWVWVPVAVDACAVAMCLYVVTRRKVDTARYLPE